MNFSPSWAKGELSAYAQVEQCFSVSGFITYKNRRRTLEGVASVSRQVCTQMPSDVLSTGMHKRVQRRLCSHTEDLAEAARAGCVYIDKTCTWRLFMSIYMHGHGLWQLMQGWKHASCTGPSQVSGPLWTRSWERLSPGLTHSPGGPGTEHAPGTQSAAGPC